MDLYHGAAQEPPYGLVHPVLIVIAFPGQSGVLLECFEIGELFLELLFVHVKFLGVHDQLLGQQSSVYRVNVVFDANDGDQA